MNFQKMNLRQLLQKYKIEIPMLQRDYAQGRVSQSKIANEFLDSIFNVLSGKNKSLHIDFIYGYQENDKFLLIDGQQRITTLWLLHFFLYKKINSLDAIKDLLVNFSYNTRESSAEFCKSLLKLDFSADEKPSSAIKNQGGEFEEEENLNNDPTIKAMLNMLDRIFEKVQEQKDIKKLVNNLDKITFDLFDMKKFELGEELYIKMNARGKQLSKYENLKSFIEKNDRISEDKELIKNIDTIWSDYFWGDKGVEKFDVRGSNFLHYATLFFKLEKLDSKNVEGEKEIIDNINNDYNLNRAVDKFYTPLQNIDNIKLLDKVVYLCKVFSTLEIKESLKLKDSKFFDKKLENSDICHFFSILFYLKESREESIEKNKNAFNDYLRICRHFIENHRLDSSDYIKSFYNLFKRLSQGYSNIYQFLKDDERISYFHSNIYTLEVRKAKLILDSRKGGENWEDMLNQTSEHKILKGWVDFLLDFSDENFVYEKYNKNKGNKKFEKPNLEKFTKYADLTMRILDKEFLNENPTLFQRAFLCIGDFGFYSTNWFYGNFPEGFREREDLNCLLIGIKNDKQMPYFKKFLDKLLTLTSQGKDLVGSMQEIINQTDLIQKEWWEQLLIKEEDLFDFLGETKDSRIRYFDKKGNQLRSSLKNVAKIELLPHKKNTTNIKDCLDYGFCCYCKRKKYDVSSYECDEEQYGKKFPLQSHFSLNNKKVLCDSMKSTIFFGNKGYLIKLEKGTDIFSEFDKVLKLIDEDKNTQ